MRNPLQPDATAAGGPGTIDATAPASAGRQVLRLIVGTSLLAVESAGSALQQLGSDQLHDQVAPAAPLPPASARHVLIGALAVGPAWLTQQMNRLARRGRGAVAGGMQRASLPLRLAARVLPTDELRRWLNQTRARAVVTALKLAEIGRHEERIARSLACAAAASGMTSVVDRIANSPKVRSLIREQSAGMGRSALNDLRAQSARADALAESVVGHFLPLSRRNKANGSGAR
jgi:hypothetical protein